MFSSISVYVFLNKDRTRSIQTNYISISYLFICLTLKEFIKPFDKLYFKNIHLNQHFERTYNLIHVWINIKWNSSFTSAELKCLKHRVKYLEDKLFKLLVVNALTLTYFLWFIPFQNLCEGLEMKKALKINIYSPVIWILFITVM